MTASAPTALPPLGIVNGTNGAARTEDWNDLRKAVARIRQFFLTVRKHFVGRHDLIKKIEMAFVMREHVLLFGPTGTAKTKLVETIMNNIEGAKVWSCDLSRSMNETQVFGDFDIRLAQETGKLMHLTEGSLLEADYANIGEILDANTPLLRSMLRVLNERQFSRGAQKMDLPLRTAIGNTNLSPLVAIKRDELLEATVDRFLFWDNMPYLEDKDDRLLLLNRESGLAPKPTLLTLNPLPYTHLDIMVGYEPPLLFS